MESILIAYLLIDFHSYIKQNSKGITKAKMVGYLFQESVFAWLQLVFVSHYQEIDKRESGKKSDQFQFFEIGEEIVHESNL